MAEGVEFIRSLTSAWECCATCAGGVLAVHDREVQAKALRDAASALGYVHHSDSTGVTVAREFLHEQADRLTPTTDQPGRVSGDEQGDQRDE